MNKEAEIAWLEHLRGRFKAEFSFFVALLGSSLLFFQTDEAELWERVHSFVVIGGATAMYALAIIAAIRASLADLMERNYFELAFGKESNQISSYPPFNLPSMLAFPLYFFNRFLVGHCLGLYLGPFRSLRDMQVALSLAHGRLVVLTIIAVLALAFAFIEQVREQYSIDMDFSP
ncbi:MAG: hypothetical protein AAF092_07830 [Pseudomonadota bacterium]